MPPAAGRELPVEFSGQIAVEAAPDLLEPARRNHHRRQIACFEPAQGQRQIAAAREYTAQRRLVERARSRLFGRHRIASLQGDAGNLAAQLQRIVGEVDLQVDLANRPVGLPQPTTAGGLAERERLVGGHLEDGIARLENPAIG